MFHFYSFHSITHKKYASNFWGLFSSLTKRYWLRDLWKFEIDVLTSTVTWTNISYNGIIETEIIDEILTELNRWYAIPFPRCDHTIFQIPDTDIIFLFGGYTSYRFFNDIWR